MPAGVAAAVVVAVAVGVSAAPDTRATLDSARAAPSSEVVFAELSSAVGVAIVERGAESRLLVTHGRRWRDVTPPGVRGKLRHATFADAEHGWAVAYDCVGEGVRVHRTRDGGRSWHRSGAVTFVGCSAGSRAEAGFLDARRGWLVRIDLAGGFAELHRTTDGGGTWSRARELPYPAEVAFRTSEEGWLGRSEFRHRNVQRLLATDDGGRTWKPRTLALPPRYGADVPLYDLPAFFGPRAVLPVTLGTGRRAAVAFYVTADGGATWRLRAVRRTGGLPRSRAGFAVYAPTSIVSPSVWWLVGRRAVVRTRDGGRTWTRTPHSLPAGRSVRVTAATAQRAWATVCCPGETLKLYSTSNGGQSWFELEPRGT